MQRHLSIPADFVHRDEVRLLGRNLSSHLLAPLVVLQLWLDWSRGGAAHRPYHHPANETTGYRNDPLVFLLAHAVRWTEVARELKLDAAEYTAVEYCIKAGVLIETPVTSHQSPVTPPGLTLTGFAEFNPHLAPGFKTIQRRGGIIKAQIAALRAAAADGDSQRRLLEQASFSFPSDEKPTALELNDAIGIILQLYIALDLPVPSSTADWAPSLVRDALHIIRMYPEDRILQVAHWVMQNRADLPRGTHPESIIRDWSLYIARVPAK